MPLITITNEAYLALISTAEKPLHPKPKRIGPNAWQIPLSSDTIARLDTYIWQGLGATYSDVIMRAVAYYRSQIH